MRTSSKGVAAVALAAILLTCAVPARAEDRAPKRSAATIVKWTLIGAATGAAVGFAVGFRAYDDATYAESKMARATLGGAGLGAGAGFAIGTIRSHANRSPDASAARSLWTPDAPMRRPAAAPSTAPRLASLSAARVYARP